jgi:hypothetical protein
MPIYKVQGPNGNIYKFEGPAGATPEEVTSFAFQHFASIKPVETPKQKEGFFPGLKEGIISTAQSTARGVAAPFQSEEDIRAGYAGQKAAAEERNVGYTPFSAVPEAYEKEGLGSALGTTYKASRDALSRSLPAMAPIIGGSATGARLGTPFGPLGVGAGAIIGGVLGGIPQFAGTNIERRIEEKTPGPLVTPEVYQTAAGQAALDTAATMFTLGTGLVAKVVGRPIAQVSEQTLLKTAERSLKGTVGRGTVRGAASEMPTEVAQQILERRQAGLDLTSEDAYREYGEAAAAAGVLGGTLGGAGNVVTRGQARGKLNEQEQARDLELAAIAQERGRIANIAATAQASERARLAAIDAELQAKEAKLRVPLTQQMELDLAPETTVEEVAAKRTAESPQGDLFAGMSAAPAVAEEDTSFALNEPTIKSFGVRKNTAAYRALESINNPEMSMDDKINLFNQVIEGKKVITPEQTQTIETFKKFMDEQKAKEIDNAYTQPLTAEPTTDRDSVQALDERGGDTTEGAPQDLFGALGTTGDNVGQPIGRTEPVAAPLVEAQEDTTNQKYADFLGSTFKRWLMENKGQDILDTMDENNVSPRDVATKFWSETYFNLPAEVQARFIKELKAQTGMQPGSVTHVDAKGNQVRADNWQDIADLVIGDMADKVDYLEGTERGFTVLMDEANRRFENIQAQEPVTAPLIEAPQAPQAQEVIRPTAEQRQQRLIEQRAEEEAARKAEKEANLAQAKSEQTPYRAVADMTPEELDGLEAAKEGNVYERTGAEEVKELPEPNPVFMQKLPEVMTSVRSELDKMGLSRVAARLEPKLLGQSGRSIAGEYSRGDAGDKVERQKLIELSLSQTEDQFNKTLNHEAIHAMRDIKLFTHADWKILSEKAEKEWLTKYNIKERWPFLEQMKDKEAQIEEAIAEAFADYKTQPAKIKSIFNRIKEFFSKLGNALKAGGFDTSETVFKRAAEGKLEGKPFYFYADKVGKPLAREQEIQPRESGADLTGDSIFRDLVSPRVQDARMNLGAAIKKITPKLLSMYQLVDQFGLEMPALRNYSELNDKMTMTQQRLKNKSQALLSDWGQFAFKNPAMYKKLGKLMVDATRSRIHPDEEIGSTANAHITKDMADAYETLSAEYNALSPEAKQIYQSAKNLLQENYQLRRTIYNDMVRGAYEDELADATPEEAKAINNRIEKSIQEHELMLNEIRGPYFPLMRFGEYLVIAESDELRELRDRLPDADKAERNKIIGLMRQMEQEDRHYQVHAFEKRSDQAREAKRLANQGLNTRESKSEEYMNSLRASSFASIDQLEKIFDREIDLDIDPAEMRKLRQAMIDSVLAGLPENSALQRQIKRRNIAGASENMLQSFAESMDRDSFYLSRMGYMKPLARSLIDMRDQSKNNMQLRDVYNNVRARMNMDVKYDNHPILSKLTGFSSIYHLGIAPSYLLTNMTQPFAITLPQLAGRYGAGKASKAIISSWSKAAQAVKGGRNGKFFSMKDTDLSKVFSGGELKMVEMLQDLGKLDIANNMDTEVYTKGMSPKMIKFWNMFNWSSHNIELMNRLTTALAAYKLEMGKTGSEVAASKAARDAVELTQLDYSDTNAAYFMKQGHMGGMNRIPMQFRKYQQGMIYLLARNFKQAWGGDKEAKNAFLYLMGTQLLMAGVRGVPVVAPLLLLMGMFGDPDDKEGDVETQLRNALADSVGADTARVFWKGLPAMMGIDSGSMSMENLFAPFPMMRASDITGAATGKDAVSEFMFNLGGAPVSMASKVMDSFILASEGDYQKALEKSLPKFISSLSKSERLGSEGITTRSGNVAVEADEFSAWDQAIKALGFSPSKESEYYNAMYQKEKISSAIDDRRNKLIKQLASARMNGEDITDAFEQVKEFNADHPVRRITGESITRSIAQRRKDKAQRAESGVRYEKRERDIKEVTRYAN